MKPTAAETDMGMPRSHRAATPPESASGTAVKTSTASSAQPSAESRSRKISAKHAGTTSARRACAAARCSNCPPKPPISRWQNHFRRHFALRLFDDRGDVASANIGGDDDAALAVLARDLILPLADRDLGDLLEQDRRRRAAARGRQRHGYVLERLKFGALLVAEADHDGKATVALEDDASLLSANRGADDVLHGRQIKPKSRDRVLVYLDV